MATFPAALDPRRERERQARRGAAWTIPRTRRIDVRYSRFVWLLRYLLPMLAIALIALVALWPQIYHSVDLFRLQTVQLDPSEVSTLRMTNARYQGIDQQNRPYLVTADVAIQNPKDKNFLALEGPKADITLETGAWVSLGADTGVYDNAQHTLDLIGDVRLFHDSGYTFETRSVRIDLNTTAAEGREAVAGHGPGGTIQAEGFRILEKGDVIQFTGKSRLVMTPEPDAPGGNPRPSLPNLGRPAAGTAKP
ncbi:MAG: LPS export ABC transporter periplasmic protein LptC [Alphaproteobacteria bacterium]